MQSQRDAVFGKLSAEDVPALINWLRSNQRSDLSGGAWFDTPTKDAALDIMASGWRAGPDRERVDLSMPVAWDALCTTDRSWGSQLHSWKFMDKPLQEFVGTQDLQFLEWCIERAVSWSERYTEQTTDNDIVWYNMALGQRALRLASLIHLAAHNGISCDNLAVLVRAANRHGRRLLSDKSFNPRTNHGYFVAIGQTVLGTALEFLPAMRQVAELGRERLTLMASTQFLADGGHSEHSPEYHRMLMRSFELAVDNGLIVEPEITGRLKKAADLLGWMIQPNGSLVPFGDTPYVNMTDGSHLPTASPGTNFLMSEGRTGQPLGDRLAVFPESGYAFVRSPQPKTDQAHSGSSYLAFLAAFHGRAHKHADDLHFTWFDLGLEILVDGGRYGYGPLLPLDSPLRAQGFYYADRFRQYVESTMAHNTVSADGRDHDRRRDPTGSGLGSCNESDGVFTLRGSAHHAGWSHYRTIRFAPGQGIRVTDDVQSTDAVKRDFCLWFNLNGRLDLIDHGDGRAAWTCPGSAWELELREHTQAALVPPVRAAESPLRGWRSVTDGTREGAWSVGLELERTRHHVFQTTLSIRTP
ncbi:heparinase II/III family protein [Pseudarthrobacter sp. NamB4]|uniref:heparinase II/III domain-containing protein n=1 Tax=Pseudarthrobacter sp. NamB4 TaxID=2576837 RepID=UPI0026C062E9